MAEPAADRHAHRGTIFVEDARVLSQESHPGRQYVLRLHNSVLTHLSGRHDAAATLTVALPRLALLQVVVGLATLADLTAAGTATVDGDVTVFDTLRSVLETPDPSFNIVLP